MAMFYGQECPLCGVKMTIDDRRFATSHFLNEESDLWRFSDAVMHWDCYATWEHQARFGRLYFEASQRGSVQNPYWTVVHSDDQLLVKVNPSKQVHQVDVMLAKSGSGFRVPLDDWERWLEDQWEGDCQHAIERQALLEVLPLLRSKLPTEAVITAFAKPVGE